MRWMVAVETWSELSLGSTIFLVGFIFFCDFLFFFFWGGGGVEGCLCICLICILLVVFLMKFCGHFVFG